MIKENIESKLYKCGLCGKIVKVMFKGSGELVCCNQSMDLQKVNIVEASIEKHIPVVKKEDIGFIVTVGSVPHPMDDTHYIQWIEVFDKSENFIKFLKPGDLPKIFFQTKSSQLIVRCFCNLHGYWETKI